MAAISSKLRSAADGHLLFWCPGCDGAHQVAVGAGPAPRWGYNGNPDAPTFTPSVLVRSGHHMPDHKGKCWCDFNKERVARGEEPSRLSCIICHSFVTDGKIKFLGDCTHALAGQAVDLPDFDGSDT